MRILVVTLANGKELKWGEGTQWEYERSEEFLKVRANGRDSAVFPPGGWMALRVLER